MEKRWLNSRLPNGKLEYRSRLSKSINSLGPLESKGSFINNMNKNIPNPKIAQQRQVGNAGVNQKSLGRAGSKCWLGKRPVVRVVVMNLVDHPHEGGEGRTPIGRKKPTTCFREEVILSDFRSLRYK